ncbi:hypothetical protein P5V15_007218 [Pogonomyrmex californicus]
MTKPYSRRQLVTLLLLLQIVSRYGHAAAAESTHAADLSPSSSASVPSGLSGPDYTGPSAGSDECDPEMVGFELVTGYVYTAPTNMLESIPGTLMLTDCLETCQANDSCQAVNYETGLCVLFSSNADSNPGKIESLSYLPKDRSTRTIDYVCADAGKLPRLLRPITALDMFPLPPPLLLLLLLFFLRRKR